MNEAEKRLLIAIGEAVMELLRSAERDSRHLPSQRVIDTLQNSLEEVSA